MSRHVVNLRADYEWDVGDGTLTLSGGLTYRSKRPNNSVNSPEVTVAPVTTYDASLAYEKGSVELRLWARNLTNERYVVTANDVTAFFYLSPTSANATTSSFLVNYSAPRTFGITGIWRY